MKDRMMMKDRSFSRPHTKFITADLYQISMMSTYKKKFSRIALVMKAKPT